MNRDLVVPKLNSLSFHQVEVERRWVGKNAKLHVGWASTYEKSLHFFQQQIGPGKCNLYNSDRQAALKVQVDANAFAFA